MSGLLKDWVNVTTWHGMQDLYRAGSVISKLAWTFLLLFTTFGFLSQIYVQFNAYISADKDPWLQMPSLERPPSIPLPIITFCNMNPASMTSLRALNMSVLAAGFIVRVSNLLNMDYSEFEDNKSTGILQIQKNAFLEYLQVHPKAAKLNFYQLLLAIAPQCDKVMDYAQCVQRRPIPIDILCANAKIFYNANNGICYSFEPNLAGKISSYLEQNFSGYEGAMVFRVLSDVRDYAPLDIPKAIDYGLSAYIGFDSLSSTLSSSRVAVRPNTHMWISMKYKKCKRPDVYSNRIFKWAIPEFPCNLKPTSLIYDTRELGTRDCLFDCRAWHTFQLCGCGVDPRPVKNVTEHPYCDVFQAYDCLRNRFKPDVLQNIHSVCVENCKKPDCDQRTVSSSVAYVKSPAQTENLQKNMKQFFDLNYDSQSMESYTVINAYYERIEVEVLEYQLRTSVDQLISNIGGQLGLWAGISIITLYQTLIYAGTGIMNTVKHLCNEQQVANAQPDLHDMHYIAKPVSDSATQTVFRPLRSPTM